MEIKEALSVFFFFILPWALVAYMVSLMMEEIRHLRDSVDSVAVSGEDARRIMYSHSRRI